MFAKLKKIRLTLAILLICLLIVAIYLVLNFGNESDTGMSTVKPEISDYSKSPTLTVDMSQRTGALKHGSAGFLYGLGEDGVPSAHILSPLKPKIAVQKAPDGMQHPNGDALNVAKTFIEAGGEQVQIYMQDYYAIWPYEFTNIDDYIKILKDMIPKVKASKYADKMVYVPFNEPDWIWYKGIDSDEAVQKRFFEDWLKVYRVIKDIDPDARIAGTGCAKYQEAFLEKFIPFCKENNCMPDIITWHELEADKLESFAQHYDHYRTLEKTNNLKEHEIVINEYAPQAHCSVPGKLVSWISIFEDKKVSACLPYWHISNNLNDMAADNNEVNGAWWLYKWYGDMSGETLKTSRTNSDQQELYGLASINENKKSANVILGGAESQCRVILNNLDKTQSFNSSKVNIKVEATYWTAYHGVAQEPSVVLEGTYQVNNGSVTIDLNEMEETAAYNITVTCAGNNDSAGYTKAGPWRKIYQAEKAELLGGATVKSKPDTNYAYSGKKQVYKIDSAGDGLRFNIEVPEKGYYKFDLLYGNGAGNNTKNPSLNKPESVQQILAIDGGKPVTMVLPNTLSQFMEGMHTEVIKLSAGKHRLEINYLSGSEGASVDCIYLTFAGTELPSSKKLYQAELSDFNQFGSNKSSAVKTENTLKDYSGSGYVTGLNTVPVARGGGIRFNVMAESNGLYKLTLRYQSELPANVNLYIDNTAITLNKLLKSIPVTVSNNKWETMAQTVFLQKGINVIDIDADADAAVDYLEVGPAEKDSDKIVTVEAEECTLLGKYEILENPFSSGGKYVKGLLGDSDKENQLILNVSVPEAGHYKMVFYHSNSELFGGHAYNAQLVDRFAAIEVNGSNPVNVFFRNTYSDDCFRTRTVDVELNAGNNEIKIYNDASRKFRCGILDGDSIRYETLVNYTPNFDKFEFYPSVLE